MTKKGKTSNHIECGYFQNNHMQQTKYGLIHHYDARDEFLPSKKIFMQILNSLLLF